MSRSESHEDCMDFLYDSANSPSNRMAGLPGAMVVTRGFPMITAEEFPAQVCRCPHGTQYYAWPNQQRIDALRALNAVN